MWMSLCWRVRINLRKSSLGSCLITGSGGPSRKFSYDWPYIDRFAKPQDRAVMVVKILPSVTARGTSYICSVGADGREERWEMMVAQLEVLERVAALAR